MEKNARCQSLYNKYNKDVPQYLWNRTIQVVNHSKLRISFAEDIPLKNITMSSEGKFFIRRQGQNARYELTFGDSQVPPACQCYTWQRARLPCKHFFAVLRHFPNWQWDKLSPAYINGPQLTIDKAIIYEPGLDNVKAQVSVSDNETDGEEIDACSISPAKEEPHSKPTEEDCKENWAQLEKKRRCRDLLAEL